MATGSACVTTVSSRSVGSSSASRTVVVPGVEDDRAAVGELVERRLRDPLLLARELALAVGDAGLEAEPLDRDRPAVHPAEQAVPLEDREVPADGLRR